MSLLVRRKSVKYCAVVNQLSVISNILVGLALLPLINSRFGVDALNEYILIFAYKSIIDLFTSSLGGAFVKEMIDKGVKSSFTLSRKLFVSYATLVVILFFFQELTINYFSFNYAFLIFIVLSLIQQPYLQRLNASGFQQVAAISRIIYNAFLFLSAVTVSLYDVAGFETIIYAIAWSSMLAFSYIMLVSFSAKKKQDVFSTWEEGDEIKLKEFFISTFRGYSLFAVFLSLTFQAEAVFLESQVSAVVFSVVIVGWKVPNIIVQLIWRYSEVSGLDIKRNMKKSKNGLHDRLKEVELNTLKISLSSSLLFLFLSGLLYKYWMGDEFAELVPLNYVLIFSFLIPVLCMNRVYTSILQYTSYVNVVSKQYCFIFFTKLVVITAFAKSFPLISMLVWLLIEGVFCFYNRNLVKNEL
ncbi:hypothetical protein OTK59_01435 [Vibrio natriegens]|uniref:hypothetical protein n=1 Tax=Vibrio natriegens TaxID=691 RepID=UPI0022848B01|nr:hypothetical protein [Vibrio natriegens]MCY9875219.1 hypothetical protein [Vibrio natriegens]